jgi:CBS-domain-containing membrane protein
MIERRIKLLPVVDAEGLLAGTLDRSALLAALAKVEEEKAEGEPPASPG